VDLDSQTLTIAGTTNEIETSASGQTITVGLPSDVTIGNNLTVTTNATISGILGVTGAAGVDGDFDVNTNKFNVQAATGNTLVAGTLGVTGNTTLSTVDVTGLASLDGGIDVDGAFTVSDTSGNISTSGTLGVTGTSTLGVINASGLASLDGGIDVDGAFTVADTTGNISTTGSLTAATGTINGLLDVVGEVQATFLDINGNGELSGNFAVDTDTLFVDSTNDRVGINKTNPAVALDVTGAAAISSTLAVTGTTSLTDDLAVDTDTLFVDASADRVGINKNNPAVALDVTGDITSSGTITGTTLAGTLSTAAQANVTSVGTLSSLAVSGDLTVDTSVLKVDSANNVVGIGTATPNPGYQLSVVGAVQAQFRSTSAATSATYGGVQIGREATGAGNGNGFGLAMYDSANAMVEYGYIGTVITDNTATTHDGAIVFYPVVNGSRALRARIDGDGLKFNADTAAANALDDYEEGTWTMGVAFGGASAGVTYLSNTGRYTKIGNQVTVRGIVSLTSKGSSTGAAVITGLPFTQVNTGEAYSTASFWLNNISFANIFQALSNLNTTSLGLWESTEAGGVTTITDGNFANNSEIVISYTYQV
jgi:hypothetical protein